MRRKMWNNARSLRSRRSYTVKELSKLLAVHIRTVQAWRKQGMAPIDPGDKPLLFMGDEIKRFLARRRQAGKHPLQADQFYCTGCRGPRSPAVGSIRVKDTRRSIGDGDSSLLVQAQCAVCGSKVNRFSTYRRLNPAWKYLLPTRAEGSLDGHGCVPVNSVIGEGE